MTGGLLVDTDVLVDLLRGDSQAAVFVRANTERLALSPIVIAELYAGAREADTEALRRLEELFPVLPVTAAIGREGGRLRARYGRSHGIGLADALLAATAAAHGLTMATLNVTHFPMFPELAPPYRK